MDLKRILVALDLPNGHDAAFERALVLAQAAGAELELLQAVPVDHRFSFYAADRLQRMTEMRRRAEQSGVRVTTMEQHGDPADIIELYADARAADLIVIADETRRAWPRRTSIAEQVIRRTTVPTLVVASDTGDRPTVFRNVLVAVDLSPVSKDVLSAAVALTSNEAEQLTVMHTVKGLEEADAVRSPARWMVPEYRTHILDEARRSVGAFVATVPANVDTRVEVKTGAAARAILDHAGDVNADLVVVGRSLGFKVLGSTAVRVLRKNERALLIVPSGTHRTKRVTRQLAA